MLATLKLIFLVPLLSLATLLPNAVDLTMPLLCHSAPAPHFGVSSRT